MLRGMTTFKCTQCGHKFLAADVEYMATAYSTPQRCLKCGSVRTRPAGVLGEEEYRKVWEGMEKEGKIKDKICRL